MALPLILKRASASRPSGEWNGDDFDVLAGGAVVGRIFKANAAPVGSPWMWTLAFGQDEESHDNARVDFRIADREALESACQPGRPACSNASRSECLMGCSCQTFVEGTVSSFQCSPCMSPRSDMYRQRAAEAKNRATQASNPHVKTAFKEVARGWLLLAEQMEWMERQDEAKEGEN
jgi:hypothetical protein